MNAGNGRGVDPGAAGTLTPQTWNPNNVNQLGQWQAGAKPGWYGHSSNVNSFFDGTGFYLQIRVKTDPRRTNTPLGLDPFAVSGKTVCFCPSGASSSVQTIVTKQAVTRSNAWRQIGSPNYHDAYIHHPTNNTMDWAEVMTSPASNYFRKQRVSDRAALGVCDPYNNDVNSCWAYATDGTWDTLLYYISPSQAGVANGHITVWAAHQNESSYTKIWDFDLPISYEIGSDIYGGVFRPGYNCLWLSCYNNANPDGSSAAGFTEFWTAYDQIIFSKNFIACPAAS
jgi:hypothetical protein